MSQLLEAIKAWKRAADDFRAIGKEPTAEQCEKVLKALEIERDTGVAVCSCCYKPWAHVRYGNVVYTSHWDQEDTAL